LCVEVSYQRFAFTPAYEALGFPQGGQPFTDFMGKFCCAEVIAQFETQTAFDICASLADFY
jgi:hypothetical protein